MPLYRGWRDCFRHLSEQKQLKRGSSLLFRYYTGPQVIVGDKVMPINRSVF
jgi:carrier protein